MQQSKASTQVFEQWLHPAREMLTTYLPTANSATHLETDPAKSYKHSRTGLHHAVLTLDGAVHISSRLGEGRPRTQHTPPIASSEPRQRVQKPQADSLLQLGVWM